MIKLHFKVFGHAHGSSLKHLWYLCILLGWWISRLDLGSSISSDNKSQNQSHLGWKEPLEIILIWPPEDGINELVLKSSQGPMLFSGLLSSDIVRLEEEPTELLERGNLISCLWMPSILLSIIGVSRGLNSWRSKGLNSWTDDEVAGRNFSQWFGPFNLITKWGVTAQQSKTHLTVTPPIEWPHQADAMSLGLDSCPLLSLTWPSHSLSSPPVANGEKWEVHSFCNYPREQSQDMHI